MRVTRYLAIVLALIAILATIGWILRNSLIERFSTPMLAEYDLVVTHVSLDAFNFFDNDSSILEVTIGSLELQHANGTTIAFEGLTLPVRAVANRAKRYSAKRVSVAAASTSDDRPLQIALYLAQFLSLPEALPGNNFYVDELQLAAYPAVTGVSWRLGDAAQHIGFSLGALNLALSATRLGPENHEILLMLRNGSASLPTRLLRGEILNMEHGVSATGLATFDLAQLTELLAANGIIPDAIHMVPADAEVQFETQIPYDAAQQYALTGKLTPGTPVQLSFEDAYGHAIANIDVDSAPIEFLAMLPEFQWSVTNEQSSLLLSYEDWNEIPLAIDNLSCNSERTCSMQTSIGIENAKLPIGNLQKFELISRQNVNFSEEGMTLEIEPGAALTIAGLSADDAGAKSIAATLVSGLTIDFSDAGWTLAADSIDTSVETLALAGDYSATASVYLERLTVSQLRDEVTLDAGVFSPMIRADTGQQAITIAGLKGDVSRRNSDIHAKLTTVGLQQNGNIDLSYSQESEQGRFSIQDATISFVNKKLSGLVQPWRRNWDLTAGTLTFGLQSEWDASGSDFRIAGTGMARLANLGGFYSDIAFAGLSTELDLDYASDKGLTTAPATIEIALVDVGLPIENISASVLFDAADLSAAIERLQMNVFGGLVRADPFSFHTASDTNNLTLHAESIELSELLAIKEFEAIEVTGSIKADLPVTVFEDGVTIVDGKLTGVPPGGVIRYRPAAGSGAQPAASSIGIVTAALSNFAYESLTSDVSYSKDGDLKLQMQLKGRNPDLQEKRPVVLNLGVENNVPQMLKSLQAARSVEDILERRMAR